jgi:hypothetical protein
VAHGARFKFKQQSLAFDQSETTIFKYKQHQDRLLLIVNSISLIFFNVNPKWKLSVENKGSMPH